MKEYVPKDKLIEWIMSNKTSGHWIILPNGTIDKIEELSITIDDNGWCWDIEDAPRNKELLLTNGECTTIGTVRSITINDEPFVSITPNMGDGDIGFMEIPVSKVPNHEK